MRINKLQLNNYKAAKNLQLDLHPTMNVIVGVNGGGKSTVLQAIAISLLKLVRRLNNKNISSLRSDIKASDITLSEDLARIRIDVDFYREEYYWSQFRWRPGVNTSLEDESGNINSLSKEIKDRFKSDESLPVLVFYPVNRIVMQDGPMQSRYRNRNDELEVYKNSLDGRPNFENFFTWFREQDDFVNQMALSRTHWVKKNSQYLSYQVSRMFSVLDDLVVNENPDIFSAESKRTQNSLELLVHEPRFLFREMQSLISFSEDKIGSYKSFELLFHELDYMLYKMDSLSGEDYDSVVDAEANLLEILDKVLTLISGVEKQGKKDENILAVIWMLFIFSFELGLWWLSDDGHRRLKEELQRVSFLNSDGTSNNNDFAFFKDSIILTVKHIIGDDAQKRSSAGINFGRGIQNVSQAIENFIPEFSNLRVDRDERGRARVLVDKNGQEFDIGMLSDGEKNLIALIGDVARRLTIANPKSEKPLDAPGIVMIDELDLHLHPKWQRRVIEKISDVFPGCQFIVTTHSPQVISHTRSESIIVLRNENGEIVQDSVNYSYGKNTDRILEDIMDVSSRPLAIKNELESLFDMIQAGCIDDAKKKIDDLRNIIGEDNDLVKARVLIKRMEIIGK